MKKVATSPTTKEIYESVFLDDIEVERRLRIRNRRSYAWWKFQYSALKHQKYSRKQIESLLKWAYAMLDTHYGFRTAAKAAWSEESLNLMVEDQRSK